jgi:hypothetical protein
MLATSTIPPSTEEKQAGNTGSLNKLSIIESAVAPFGKRAVIPLISNLPEQKNNTTKVP